MEQGSIAVSRLLRLSLPPRLPLLAAFAALMLLAWILYYWISAFLTPQQPIQTTTTNRPLLSKVLAEQVVALRLFGGGTPAVESAPVAAASSIGVHGVYAGRDGRSGFAILVLDGKPLPAVVGHEFAPGMQLQRVYPDSVEILRGGQVETARMTTAAMPVPGRVPQPAAKSASGVLQLAVHQLGEGSFVLSREEMIQTMHRPDQLAMLGGYTPNPLGGALLEQSPAGGLPEKLGLKVGDVVTRINGKQLAGPGDVARLNEQLTKNEHVKMDVLRAGKRINVEIQMEQ